MSQVDPSETEPNTIWMRRGRWLFVVAIAAMLRFSHLDRVSLEHFDEAVYASNKWFTDLPTGGYPARDFYAPPLWPAIVDLFLRGGTATGILREPVWAIVPGMLAGWATVVSLWWIGRQWGGPTVGLGLALIVAGHEFHVVYSRSALTDVPVTLAIVWAVYFIHAALLPAASTDVLSGSATTTSSTARHRPLTSRALSSAAPGLSLVGRNALFFAGICTGLAWWIKYTGWLPLAIAGAGAGCWWWSQRLAPTADRPQLIRLVVRWLGIALVAGLIWSPVWWGLQGVGGYAAVAQHHLGYTVGFRGWWSSFTQLWADQQAYNGLLSLVALAYGSWIMLTGDGSTRPTDSKESPRSAKWPLALAATILAVGIASMGGLIALGTIAAVGLLVSLWTPGSTTRWTRTEALAAALVVSWQFGLVVMTPTYLPYPRLLVPLLISSGLCWALAASRLSRSWSKESEPPTADAAPATAATGHSIPRRNSVIELVIGIVGLVLISLRMTIPGLSLADWRHSHIWENRLSYERLAFQLTRDITAANRTTKHPPEESIVYCYGEPALFFHLRSLGWPNVGPIGDPAGLISGPRPPRPTYVVVGQQPEPLGAEFEMLWEYHVRPSSLALWDAVDPRAALRDPPQGQRALRVYRLRRSIN